MTGSIVIGYTAFMNPSLMTSEELLQKTDIEEIAREGEKIYLSIKEQYGSQDRGKFLAIDTKSGSVYFGQTSNEAVELARQAHPDTIFYVVKIGFSVTETLAGMGIYAERLH